MAYFYSSMAAAVGSVDARVRKFASIRPSLAVWMLLLSFLLTALLRLPYYQHSFTFIDEAWWAQGGKAWLDGKLLYRDIWLDKNPPIFLFSGFLFKLLGPQMWSLHLGALLLVCLISLALFLVGRTFFSARVGGAAAVLYAVASTTFYTPRIIGLNTETLMVLFTTTAMGLFLSGWRHPRGLGFLLAGLASSMAFFTKPVALTQMALFALLVATALDHPIRMRLRSLAMLGLGFVSGVSAFALFLHAGGMLGFWWEQAVVYGFTYVSRIPWTAFAGKVFSSTGSFMVIYSWLLILVAGAWFGGRKRFPALPLRVVSFWIFSALVGVVAGRRFYANYYIQLLPPLTLVGSIGLVALWERRQDLPAKRALQVAAAALIPAFVWFHIQTAAHWYFLFNPAAHHRANFWGICREDRHTTAIAEYLKARTAPGQSIFIWGSKAQIYFLAERNPAIPHMDYDVADDVPPNAAAIPVRIATALKLRGSQPAYLVDVQHHARMEKYPVFWNLLRDLYEYETSIHGARLYRLRAHPAPPGPAPKQST